MDIASRRVHLAPVVDADGRIVGIITEDGAMRSTVYDPAVDSDGREAITTGSILIGDGQEDELLSLNELRRAATVTCLPIFVYLAKAVPTVPTFTVGVQVPSS